jgi:hypothetical protein
MSYAPSGSNRNKPTNQASDKGVTLHSPYQLPFRHRAHNFVVMIVERELEEKG